MGRLYKCYGTCGEKYEKEKMVSIGGKRYCKPCGEAMEKRKKDISELHHTIMNLYKVDFPTGGMLKQIENYMKQRGYTYEGITQTLKYLNSQGASFEIKYGLGLVGYKYEEAKNFFKRQEEIASSNMFADSNPEFKEEVVRTKRPNNINVIKQERLINLEELI